jgi:hypothetical protein
MFEFSELQVHEKLGDGGFAVVFRGTLPDGTEVAIKKLTEDEVRLRENPGAASEYYAEFRREVWMMSGMRHENILRLFGVCKTPMCMILELAVAGNLFFWIHKDDKPPDPSEFPLRENLASDVALGMDFLHSMTPPIIHRDLKSPNGVQKMQGEWRGKRRDEEGGGGRRKRVQGGRRVEGGGRREEGGGWRMEGGGRRVGVASRMTEGAGNRVSHLFSTPCPRPRPKPACRKNCGFWIIPRIGMEYDLRREGRR